MSGNAPLYGVTKLAIPGKKTLLLPSDKAHKSPYAARRGDFCGQNPIDTGGRVEKIGFLPRVERK